MSPVLDPVEADGRQLTRGRQGGTEEAAPHRPAGLAAPRRGAGADVGESTVRRYVGEARRRQPMALREVTVPQHHPLGEEAEVHFGSISFYLNGLLTEGWMFVMRLSASGKGFHRIHLNQAQQVFLDGHVRAFEHFGGVPTARIRYDNLKPPVVRVLKGRDRQETERFIALRSHYGFDSFFCTPGEEGAHEKGRRRG